MSDPLDDLRKQLRKELSGWIGWPGKGDKWIDATGCSEARPVWDLLEQIIAAALAAGRRAGLEEASGEAERMNQDWLARNEKTYGELAVKLSESSPLRTLATTLRARADGKGRP